MTGWPEGTEEGWGFAMSHSLRDFSTRIWKKGNVTDVVPRNVLPVVLGALLVLGACRPEEVLSPSTPGPLVETEGNEASVAATTSSWSGQPLRPEPTDLAGGYPASTRAYSTYPEPQWELTPARPTLEPTASPTPFRTPSATPLPLLLSDLSAAQVSTMGTWQSVDNDTAFSLYRITNTPRGVASVSWGPGGQHLVAELLTSEQTMMGYETVPIIVPRGGESTWSPLILGNGAAREAYSWSPDGSRLSFIRDGELQVIGASGDRIQTYLPPPNHHLLAGPDFLPEGNRIAVTSWSNEGDRIGAELWVYDLDTGVPSLLLGAPACGARSSWSPQGDAVACLVEDYDSARFPGGAATVRIEALDGTSSVAVELASLPGTEGRLAEPQWVDNGRAVVVTVMLQPGVWLVDRDGRVTSLSSWSAQPTTGWGEASVNPTGQFVLFDPGPGEPIVLDVTTDVWTPMPALSVTLARWARTGPQFLTWTPYYHPEWAGTPLQLVDGLTGEAETLDDSGGWPSWSPDGRRIAYWKKGEDGKMALWLLEIGLEPVRLTVPGRETLGDSLAGTGFFPLGHYDLTPQWSPDGSALAFVSWREPLPEAYVLELK
jgi:hypothetical protein